MISLGLPPRREKQFQQAIVDAAKNFGYLVFHSYDSRRSEPGFPDLVICGHGRIIFAEVKRKGGYYTDAQRRWLAELMGTPAEVFTWIAGVDDIRDIADILRRPRSAA